MQVTIPPTLTKEHRKVLTTYLSDDRFLRSAEWQKIYEAIDLLEDAQLILRNQTKTFRQLYNEYIDGRFADLYLDQLLKLSDVTRQSPALTSKFARQISPFLKRAGLLRQGVTDNWLLLAYCIYWWQSFARGYTFEVEIIRDLEASGVNFWTHDLRRRTAYLGRYSKVDLMVLGLKGDIKTSTYFLKFQSSTKITNDFYITRLYEKGRKRTLVVFQKPIAWNTINGDIVVDGTLERLLRLLPQPVRLQQDNVTLIVVEYDSWKEKVLRKQNQGE